MVAKAPSYLVGNNSYLQVSLLAVLKFPDSATKSAYYTIYPFGNSYNISLVMLSWVQMNYFQALLLC